MLYDINKRYTVREFEVLPHDQLIELLKSAKSVSSHLASLKDIKRVSSDMVAMRQVLKGFNKNHNLRGRE